MVKNGCPKFYIVFSILFVVNISNVLAQDVHLLNPKKVFTPKKYNHNIKTIKEFNYRLVSNDEAVQIDTIISLNLIEYKLALHSYSISEFIPNKKTVIHYDNNGDRNVIWTYQYDNSGNQLCSILNYKEIENEIDNWADISNGFKYCQSYDANHQITNMTQQDGTDSMRNTLIVNYRNDGLIDKINVGSPWLEIVQVFEAIEHGDTIRYVQSFEHYGETAGREKDRESFDGLPRVYIDLIRDKKTFTFYHYEENLHLDSVFLIENHLFDQYWNKKETIKYNHEEIVSHKLFKYNQLNQIIQIKDLINNRLELFKYDIYGNLIFHDNDYLLMYKKYDKNGNMLMDYKLYKETGILKELSTYEIN